MTAVPSGSVMVDAVAAAFSFGSATRNDLLTAAVTARASTTVIEELLRLPDRRFDCSSEVLACLAHRAA